MIRVLSRGAPRSGLTAIEVVVVLVIFLVIIGLVAPVLMRVREQSRDAQCQNNLRQLGVALLQFAEENSKTQLCTGASDFLTDGCPTEFGWIADLYRLKRLSGATLHCPSHAARHTQGLADLVGTNGVPSVSQLPPRMNSRLGGDCIDFEVFQASDNALMQGTAAPGSPERIHFASEMIRHGQTTNYTPSWYLVRSGIDWLPTEDGLWQTSPDGPISDRGATIGPLTLRLLEMTSIPSGNIPLLAEGTPVNSASGAISKVSGVSAGEPLVATSLTGPAAWDAETSEILSLPPGTVSDRKGEGDCEVGPFCGDQLPTPNDPGSGGVDGKLWLQDTRHWAPQHPDFSTGLLTINLLMADGSVKKLHDLNGDHWINPGFPLHDQPADIPLVEMPPFQVYTGEIVPRSYQQDSF